MIKINHVSKSFTTADGQIDALKDVNLTIPDGAVLGIIGMSGAGKSTLVRCINMLERPTEGTVEIDGVDLGALKPKALREMRRNVTMIFQGFNLLMQRNCLANVAFPMELCGVGRAEAKKRALELLDTVGLADKAAAYPAQLSGGQQQRVAIARALATNPKVLLCDEATSALDPNTTNSILELIGEINRRLGITVIIITHQMSVVEKVCDRVAILDGGCVVEEGLVSEVFSHPKSHAARQLVYPDNDSNAIAGTGAVTDDMIRVVFNGAEAAADPVIARMAIEEGIEASIAYASTRSIGGKVYGSMLLTIPGGTEAVARAIAYFERITDVTAQEVSENE